MIELIVRGIIFKDGNVLLCKNLKHGHYFLPGGHLEKSENPEDALRREMAEEIDRTPEKVRFVTEVKNSFVQDGQKVDEIFSIFLVTLDDYRSITSKEGHLAFEWKPLDDLSSIDFKPQKSIKDIQLCVKTNSDFWL